MVIDCWGWKLSCQFLSFSMLRRLKVGKNPSYIHSCTVVQPCLQKRLCDRGCSLLTSHNGLDLHFWVFKNKILFLRYKLNTSSNWSLIAWGGSYHAHKRNYTSSLCLEFDGSSQFFIFQQKWLWNGAALPHRLRASRIASTQFFYFPRL